MRLLRRTAIIILIPRPKATNITGALENAPTTVFPELGRRTQQEIIAFAVRTAHNGSSVNHGDAHTGRSRKYPYYHCRKCKQVKAGKQSLETHFVNLLSRLQPEAGYMRLFKAIVLDVWKGRQGESRRRRDNLEAVVKQKRERLDRIDEAFLHDRSIDRQTYERQRDQVREQLALAEMELGAATEAQLDVEGLLAFAEHLLTNASALWIDLDLNQKQQFQQVLFPEGLQFDGAGFRTAVICLAFKQLPENENAESSLASPPGTDNMYSPLRGRLRRAVGPGQSQLGQN